MTWLQRSVCFANSEFIENTEVRVRLQEQVGEMARALAAEALPEFDYEIDAEERYVEHSEKDHDPLHRRAPGSPGALPSRTCLNAKVRPDRHNPVLRGFRPISPQFSVEMPGIGGWGSTRRNRLGRPKSLVSQTNGFDTLARPSRAAQPALRRLQQAQRLHHSGSSRRNLDGGVELRPAERSTPAPGRSTRTRRRRSPGTTTPTRRARRRSRHWAPPSTSTPPAGCRAASRGRVRWSRSPPTPRWTTRAAITAAPWPATSGMNSKFSHASSPSHRAAGAPPILALNRSGYWVDEWLPQMVRRST